MRPLEEIAATEALTLKTYCVAWFNAEGRILHAQRFEDGERVTDERYTYSDNRLIERIWIDADGQEHVEPWAPQRKGK